MCLLNLCWFLPQNSPDFVCSTLNSPFRNVCNHMTPENVLSSQQHTWKESLNRVSHHMLY